MLIPVGKGGEELDKLTRREKKARELADQWLSALREAYFWLMPERFYMMEGGDARNVNAKQRPIYDHIFDPIGMQSIEDGASQVAEALHPFDMQWIKWTPRDDTKPDQRGKVQGRCEEYTNAANALLRRSNFDVEAPKAHPDFLLGAGFLRLDRDPEDPTRVRFCALPAYRWAIEEDSSGKLCGKYLVEKPKARELPYIEGGQYRFSQERNDMIKEQPDAEVELRTAYIWDYATKSWELTVWDVAEKYVVFSAAYKTCPIISYRCGVIAGQTWGAGPGLKCTPDVKVANLTVEMTLKNASIAVAGMWQADDDGVLNPATIRLVPGAIIPKAVGSAGLQPLQAPGKFDISNLVLDAQRTSIRRALYVVKPADREMTATEFTGRQSQMLREMRGSYGPLSSEFAEPLAARLLDLAGQMGLIEVGDQIHAMTQIQLTGPLAQDVRSSGATKIRMVQSAMAQVYGQEIAAMTTKLPTFLARMISEYGADPAVFLSETEAGAVQGQIGQALLKATQQQGVPAAAGNGAAAPQPMAAA